jgi:peptidoglycan hydrolase-like protein with peptidoglycan-binding domain
MSARLRTPNSNWLPAPPRTSGVLQRQCAACGNHKPAGGNCDGCKKNKTLLRDAINGEDFGSAPPVVDEVLNSPGQPLGLGTRTFMERRFSHDFSGIPAISRPQSIAGAGITVGGHDDPSEHQAETVAERVASDNSPAHEQSHTGSKQTDFSEVRVHTGPKAAESARAIGAKAYTVSNAVVFGDGQYAPETPAGKSLLAHELTHVMQQRNSPAIQRACDPATFAARTFPVFFPKQTKVNRVYGGTGTINSASGGVAIKLVQQALVDLGFLSDTSGPNHDGVDGDFGAKTLQAVIDFQTAESVVGHTPGVVDQGTLKCLDEVRSHRVMPQNLTGVVPPDQFEVEGEETGGRDENIFFERGSAVLDVADDTEKIKRLTLANKGCAITLNAFISEDERIDFGDQLATDRLNAVDAAFHAENQEDPGVCVPPPPPPPVRTLVAQPDKSGGVISFTGRRMVEVVTASSPSRTAQCPRDAIRQRPLTAVPTPAVPGGPDEPAEKPFLTDAVADGLTMLETARNKLVSGNADGDAALTAFFGGISRRSTVREKLRIWRNHVRSVIPRRSQRGTDCDSACANSIAYNNGTGGSAKMTLCSDFFGTINLYPGLSDAQKRALVLVHEAGHGALDTQDLGYDNVRLIHFIQTTPSLALQNTDSFISLIRQLNGLGAPAARADTATDMDAAELKKAQEGLAWLQSWMIWGEQDAGGAYDEINTARTKGRWKNTYYQDVANLILRLFNVHRPGPAALPTMREQTTVAAIWNRMNVLEEALDQDLKIAKDISASPAQRWEAGVTGPSDELFLTDLYFSVSSVRGRVNMLLALAIEATPAIDPALRLSYINFIKETVRLNWGNHP